MREVWESREAGQMLVTKFYDLPHFCSREVQEEVLEFFDKHIKQIHKR